MEKTGRFRRRLRIFWRRNYALLTLLPLLVLLGYYALEIEPRRWIVKRCEVASPRWPAALDGMKIAFLSDFHFDANVTAMLPEVTAAINAEKPDLVLLGGDFFTNGAVLPESMKVLQECLASLHPRFGICAVNGNHESPEEQAHDLFEPLAEQGVRWLLDESVSLGPDYARFTVIGLAYGSRPPGGAGKRSASLCSGTEPAILLAHDPSTFAEHAAPILLMCAGHTHGGQVRLPLTGSLIHPSRYPKKYDYGMVAEGGRTLMTTGGFGLSKIRLRFNVPPEAVVITMRSVPPPAVREGR